MRKIFVALFVLVSAAAIASPNYLRDNGTFQDVLTNTTPGQLLQNQGGVLGGVASTALPITVTVGSTTISGGSSTGVLYNNSGVVGASSDLTFVPGGPLTITPTTTTNNQGFVLNQTTPNTGSIAGPISLNSITVIDQGQTVTGGFPLDQWGTITNQTDAFRINYRVTGGAASHIGAMVMSDVTGTNGGTASIMAGTHVNVGTITGNLWSVIGFGIVGPSGNLNQSLIGVEAEMLVADTGVVKDRIAFSCNSQGPTTATRIDACLVASTFNLGVTNYLTAAPWGNFIYLNNSLYGSSTFPVATTGSIILADTGTVTNFFSAHTLTITGNIIDTPNVLLTGSGSLRMFNSVSAGALIVTANSGTANAALTVDTSNGSGNGVYIFSTAAGNGANMNVTSSTTNEAFKINAKGAGTIDLAGTLTGGVTVHGSFTATGLVTNADLANSTISGVALGSNLATLTYGTHLTNSAGASTYNGSAASTLATDATNANTASTIVARDGSGNFTAGTIAAALTGHASSDLALTGGTMSGAIAMGTNA